LEDGADEPEVLSQLELEASQRRTGRVGERVDVVGAAAGDERRLDGLVDALVEKAQRDELERREEPLPAQVVVADVGFDESGIACERTQAARGGKDRRSELTELGP